MKTETNSDQHRWRVRMLFLHGAMLTAPLALLVTHLLFHVSSFGVCAFRTIIGVDCPACGITRSAMALFGGDITRSFHLHPAGPVIVAIVGVITFYLCVVLFTDVRGLEWRKEVKASTGCEWAALVALLIGWIGKVFIK